MQNPTPQQDLFPEDDEFTIPHYITPKRSIKRIMSMFLQVIIGAYGISVTGQVVLRIIFGDSWAWLAFFNTFAHMLWIGALILLPICLVWRKWNLSITLIVPVITLITTYGVLFTPRTPEITDEMTHFSLLTYNLHAEEQQLDDIIDFIIEQNADIVLVQELSVTAATYFKPRLEAYYPYQALHPQADDATAGNGVFSRIPLESDEYWQYEWLLIPLGHQRVTLQIADTPITIYNVHPSHPGMSGSFFDPTNRGREIDDVLNRISEESNPVILAGDFNSSDLTSDYARIATQLTDSYKERGWGMGFTFPNVRAGNLPILHNISLIQDVMVPPFLRLDYVFHSEGLRALDATVMTQQRTSDHLPLLVRLALE